MDKATLKHAKYNRDELGFYDDFTRVNPKIQQYLEALNIDMFCVRGNHEDHGFLDDLEMKYSNQSRFSIDAYQRVWVCKTGKAQYFQANEQTLSFVGIGRIGDRKGRKEKRFIQNYEKAALKELMASDEDFDLLITHDSDGSSQRGYGMQAIREVLDNVIFHYHFYGHTGEPFRIEEDDNGITQSCKIKELEFQEDGYLPKGCMVILQKLKAAIFELEIVSTDLTNQLTADNWKN